MKAGLVQQPRQEAVDIPSVLITNHSADGLEEDHGVERVEPLPLHAPAEPVEVVTDDNAFPLPLQTRLHALPVEVLSWIEALRVHFRVFQEPLDLLFWH